MSRKHRREWWDDEAEYYDRYAGVYARPGEISEGTGATKGYGWNKSKTQTAYDYKSYFYKKSFDFSIGLETRINSLIKTISGKDLRLAEADGWGSDDKYFYYNPQDLANATDDQVLGLVFHQLARQLFYPVKLVKAINKTEPEYRHLLETLEDQRMDRLMQDRYAGASYYLDTAWTEKREKKPSLPIKALKFCYDVTMIAHGEPPSELIIGELSSKASEAIEKYLSAQTIDQEAYQEIKKHYPIPDEDEQAQMDQAMQGTSVLSDQQRQLARKQANTEALQEDGRDMDKGFDLSESEKKGNVSYQNYEAQVIKHKATINQLAQVLRSIIQDNETKRYIGNQKRGKINAKSLHKMIMGLSNRVFKKEREVSRKKYAFSILVDQSGSMDGKKIHTAFAGSVILAEVFKKLEIDFEVIGFDFVTRIYKRFGSKPKPEVIGGILNATGGGTHDSKAIEKAGERLKSMACNQRTMFVIGDGDGQGMRTYDLVKNLALKDQIKVYGLGIGGVSEASFKRTYPKYAVMDNPDDLVKTLIGLIKEQFQRN